MQRAVSVRAKCRPVPGAPQSRMTFRAVGASVPSTKGRRIARTTPSTKASCPSTVFFTSAASPSKLPRCSCLTSVVPLASRPSASISSSIFRLWASASCVVSLRSSAFCFFSISSSFFCCSSRAAFISGRPGFSGGVFCVSKRSFPPGPNTPFIKFSQSSVYAICLPPSCVFPSIVYFAPFCKKSLENPRAGGYTNFILI